MFSLANVLAKLKTEFLSKFVKDNIFFVAGKVLPNQNVGTIYLTNQNGPIRSFTQLKNSYC